MQLRFVADLSLFCPTGYLVIDPAEDWRKPGQVLLSFSIYIGAICRQLTVEAGKNGGIQMSSTCRLPEQGIALGEYLVVIDEALQVKGVLLRDGLIEKAPPLFTSIIDDGDIIRCDHGHRQQADMVGKPVVGHIVFKHLLFPGLHPARYVKRTAIDIELAVNTEKVGPMLHHLGIGAGEVTFAKAEIVYGVDQIRFAGTIPAVDQGKAVPEFCLRRSVVFIVQEAYTA